MSEQFDIIVIGGGTAGLVTASGCARLGRKVALIEKEALGGDCLWTGCVPTKALVASAKLVHQMRHADQFGIEPAEARIAPKQVLDSMREAQRIAGKHDDPAKFRKLGIDVIEGEARFTAPRVIEVNGRSLEGRDIVIATGSRTAVPPIDGLKETAFLDHASFLGQDDFPRSVTILGGGYIGIEFAQIFRRFGAKVTVVEMLDDILLKEDQDVIGGVRQLLESETIDLRLGWKVVKADKRDGAKWLHMEDRKGQKASVSAAEVFIASGRRGNIEGLGLEIPGVKTERSYVVVDKYLQTSVPHIWACGDIHGALQFTHVAAYEAVKLVRNLLFPGKSAVNYDNVPWALYTDPEVAHIGLTETEARQRFGEIKTYRVAMEDVDRAVVDRTTRGFIKFVTDRRGKVLGAHAFCSHASTLIGQVVLARKKKLKIGELAQLVSPYPSLADSIQKTASLYYQEVGRGWLGALARRVAAISQ